MLISVFRKSVLITSRMVITNMMSNMSIKENNGIHEENGFDEKVEEMIDQRDSIVQKPENESDYRVLTLQNGLRCLLVSDTNITKSENAAFRAHKGIDCTEKAAACLTVRAGSVHEPRHIPGLAHFLEHMLFMGCVKYPNENEYDEYLDLHGGSSNASTDYETTSYLFDVSSGYLEGALDRFAHQFIDPLLRKSSVFREVKAVDSEYEEGLQSDTARVDAICTSLLQPDHPYNMFPCGNKHSLTGPVSKDVLAELRSFYEKYYSADLMCLCIESPESLDSLEKMAQVFEGIPNRNVPVPSLKDQPLPKLSCNFIRYYPVKDKTKLTLSWFVSPQMDHYRSKPDEYVEWCVGHEGTGSLLTKLKQKEYATYLEAGTGAGGFESGTNFSRFFIEIGLSDKGLDNYLEIVKMTFQYLSMLKEKLPSERIYEEIKKMRQIDFDFMENEDPYDKVEDLSDNMTLYPPEHYLSGPELLFEYDPDLIMKMVNSLTPESALLILQSQSFKEECTEQEKWYRGMYKTDSLPLAALEDTGPGEFHLPEPNIFIAEDFEIKEIDVEGPTVAPVVISDDSRYKLWFHKDEVFEQPECILYWQIYSKNLGQDISVAARSSLFAEIYCNRVTEMFYPAELAGLSSKLRIEREGVQLKFEGYNHKMLPYFKAVCDQLFDCDSQDITSNFEAVKDTMIRNMRISTLKPKKYADELRQTILREVFYSSDAYADALQGVSLHDIQSYRLKDQGGFYLESLTGGNITADELDEYLGYLSDKLDFDNNAMKRNEIFQRRVYKLPLGRWVHRVKNKNKEDINSVVVNYYQHDAVSFRDTAILSVLEDLMNEPMFNQLRTRLQLGYSVSVSDHETFGVTGFSFTVCTQATKFSTSAVNVYIEVFLSWFKNYLNKITDEDFEQRISECIKSKLIPHITIDDEMEQMWSEITVQEYIFDRDQRMAEVMKQLTKGEIISFYHNLFFKNVRKLSIQVEGNPDGTVFSKEKSGSDSESNSESDSSSEEEEGERKSVRVKHMKHVSKEAVMNWDEEAEEIASIEEFHTKCSLLPVYKLVTQVVTVDVTNR